MKMCIFYKGPSVQKIVLYKSFLKKNPVLQNMYVKKNVINFETVLVSILEYFSLLFSVAMRKRSWK